MHHRRLIAIVCGVAAALVGTSGRVVAQSPGILLGRVVIEGSRQPVAGACITLERIDGARKLTIVADAQGRFSHLGVRPGFYTVTIESAGYAPVDVLGVEIRPNDKVRLSIDATPSDEAPFSRRVIRYRRPLINVEDATLTTRIL